MTRSYPEWAYLVDESGRYWYHLQNGARQPVEGTDGQKPPQRALYAIPTNDLVSHPHWISSKDEEIISQIVAVENEKLGVKSEDGPGRITDWKPVEINGSRTLVQSVSIPWTFENLTGGPTEFVDFFPQYALFVPPENAVTLWREEDGWVAGYSRAKRWAHVQPLGEIDPELVAGEIELTLMELSAKGIIGEIEQIVVWSDEEPALRSALESPGGIPVEFRPRPAPTPAAAPHWKFEPHEVSLARLRKTQQKRFALGIVLGVFALLFLAAAAFLHIKILEAENERLEGKIAANIEEKNKIEATSDRWFALSPAIDSKRSPLELFHRVSTLLPDKGFRFTEFEYQDYKTLIIRGEGATMANALQIEGALKKSNELADFEWEIQPPRTKNDLTEFFATGTYKF